MLRPGGIRIRIIGTLLASPVTATTTRLLRTRVVVTALGILDADNSICSNIWLVIGNGESQGWGFPFFCAMFYIVAKLENCILIHHRLASQVLRHDSCHWHGSAIAFFILSKIIVIICGCSRFFSLSLHYSFEASRDGTIPLQPSLHHGHGGKKDAN